MLAWLLIGLTLTLDIPIRDLFKWVGPLASRIREALERPIKTSEPTLDGIDVQANGYTPMQRPPVPVGVPQAGEAQVGIPHYHQQRTTCDRVDAAARQRYSG